MHARGAGPRARALCQPGVAAGRARGHSICVSECFIHELFVTASSNRTARTTLLNYVLLTLLATSRWPSHLALPCLAFHAHLGAHRHSNIEIQGDSRKASLPRPTTATGQGGLASKPLRAAVDSLGSAVDSLGSAVDSLGSAGLVAGLLQSRCHQSLATCSRN